MSGMNSVTATVHIILLDIEDLEAVRLEEILQRLERIILQVLMTDIPDVVLFKH